MLQRKEFENPPMKYRPLQIVHDILRLESGIEQVCPGVRPALGITGTRATTRIQPTIGGVEFRRYIIPRLKRLKELGFGGVVANVPWEDYLESEDNWKIFEHLLIEARRKGLTVWFYDEKGYPSGSAGGLVLRGYPEFEATGLVSILREVQGPTLVEMKPPPGCQMFLHAIAYRTVNNGELKMEESIDLSREVDSDGKLRWRAPSGKWLVSYFAAKPLFEKTHAERNYYGVRRYINVLDRRAVERFIKVTYERYMQRFSKHVGKTLRASFTDEPSFICAIMPEIEKTRSPVKEDQPDENIPFYPALPWFEGLFEEFEEKRGYDLKPFLVDLFRGESNRAKRVRCHFHRTLSEVYSESFFKQISSFCSEKGIAFSGHVLSEESLIWHAIFEGDILSQLKHMHIPGIDMLSSDPFAIMRGKYFLTPKFASSAAHLHGKKHVMSETCAFLVQHGGFSLEKMIGTANILYALGVNIITSYYPDEVLPPSEYRVYCDYVARLGVALTGGRHVAPVALYYPIESIWAEYLPSNESYQKPYSEVAIRIDDSFEGICRALISNQLDFDVIDSEEVSLARVENRKLRTKFEEYSALIIPPMEIVDLPTLKRMKEFARRGVFLIFHLPQATIGMMDGDDPLVRSTFNSLLSQENVIFVANPAEMIDTVFKKLDPDFHLEDPNSNILYLHRRYPGKDVYFVVNTGSKPTMVSATLSSSGKVEVWDPLTGEIKMMKDDENWVEGEKVKVRLSLKPNAGMFVVVSQSTKQ